MLHYPHTMMNDIQSIIGKNIYELRISQQLTQEKLAELTGLHRTYIGGVERGERNVSLKNIVRIARALEVSPAHLMKGIQ